MLFFQDLKKKKKPELLWFKGNRILPILIKSFLQEKIKRKVSSVLFLFT